MKRKTSAQPTWKKVWQDIKNNNPNFPRVYIEYKGQKIEVEPTEGLIPIIIAKALLSDTTKPGSSVTFIE
jgi:hypothetical protein